MCLRRLLAALAATAALALGASGAPVAAAFQPVTAVTWTCDGGAYITVWIETEGGESYDVHIGPEVWAGSTDGSYGEGPFADGFVPVRVLDTGGGLVFETNVLVACDAPLADVTAVCGEGGGHLLIDLAGDPEWEYLIYVDDTDTPLGGVVGGSGTSGEYADLGEFADGTHTVYVDWLDDQSDAFSIETTIDVGCGEDGSGGAIPDTGSATEQLLIVATTFVVAGAGLLVSRRVRSA